MTITARYASTCPCCSARIAVGEQVEWTQGSPARHVSCAVATKAGLSASPQIAPGLRIGSPSAPARRYVSTSPRSGCACGSREGESRVGDCWTCRHDAE